MSCERSTCPWRALATVSAMLVMRTVKRVPAGRNGNSDEDRITAVTGSGSADAWHLMLSSTWSVGVRWNQQNLLVIPICSVQRESISSYQLEQASLDGPPGIYIGEPASADLHNFHMCGTQTPDVIHCTVGSVQARKVAR